MNAKVDIYLKDAGKWRAEMIALRAILLASGLTEELKWGVPVYMFQKANVAGINGLKGFCALSFFKGVLLKDPEGILIQPGENTQSGRWAKFTSVAEVVRLGPTLKAYIDEAIEVEKAGLKVDFTPNLTPTRPEELQRKLDQMPALNAAFEALTPGRQRAYCLHFSAPKQAKTRESRIEKCIDLILSGKGLNDCTCGLSQRMPSCDGSHKNL